jgi:hypothetical protein
MLPLARFISPAPDPLVVTELVVGPLSEPPLPWLDCASAGTVDSENAQAATNIAFRIIYLRRVSAGSTVCKGLRSSNRG